MLFQWEIGRQEPRRIEEGFWRMAKAEKNTRTLANQIFEGSVRACEELDTLLGQHAENWRPERMALIDRAILRMAAWELREGKTPAKVVVNEAVELAKTFSSQEATAFVNGVLDSLLKAIPK
jgi:transcription antitermination protein NusB